MGGAPQPHLRFVEKGPTPSGKTFVVAVETTSGAELGTIRWRGAWRRYVFYPSAGTLFDGSCLRLIATEAEQMTSEHRKKRQ